MWGLTNKDTQKKPGHLFCLLSQTGGSPEHTALPNLTLLCSHPSGQGSPEWLSCFCSHTACVFLTQSTPAPGRACQGGDAQGALSLQPPLSQFSIKKRTPTLHLCLPPAFALRHRREHHSSEHLPSARRTYQDQSQSFPPSISWTPFPWLSSGVLWRGALSHNPPPLEGGLSLWEVHFKPQSGRLKLYYKRPILLSKTSNYNLNFLWKILLFTADAY